MKIDFELQKLAMIAASHKARASIVDVGCAACLKNEYISLLKLNLMYSILAHPYYQFDGITVKQNSWCILHGVEVRTSPELNCARALLRAGSNLNTI